MKKFFQKQREIMALLAFVVVFLALIYFVIFPLLKKISDMNYQIQEGSAKQEIVSQHISELPKIQKQYETLKAEDDLTNVLLEKEKAVILIEKLEKIAQQTNNEIVISVQENVEAKKVTAKSKTANENTLISELPKSEYLQLKITLDGSYASIVSFVKALEKFEYYCDIVGIQINGNESEKASTLSVGMGIENPFISREKRESLTSAKNKKDGLNALLDVVFYTK